MPERTTTDRPAVRGLRARRGTVAATVGQPVELPMLEPPPVGRIPAGWRVIGSRELAEHLLSVRFLILLVIMAVAGALAVYTLTAAIQRQAGQIAGVPFFNGQTYPVFLFLFSAPPAGSDATLQAIPSFAGVMAIFLGPLVGLAFGFDAISNERAEGTLPRLVSQPIHRDDVINGKFVASLSIVALMLGAVMLILAGIGIYRLGIFPSADVALRLVGWYLVAVVYVAFWLALALLASVIFRRAATAALTVLSLWLVLTFFGGQIVTIIAGFLAPYGSNGTAAEQLSNANMVTTLYGLIPNGMFASISAVLLRPETTTLGPIVQDPSGRALPALLPFNQSLLLVWPQIVLLLAATAICFALAYVAFMRQEVRA
jgi:ABC-2 type transport system permease protein